MEERNYRNTLSRRRDTKTIQQKLYAPIWIFIQIYSLNKKLEILKKELSLLENNISFFNDKSNENKILDKSRKEIEKKKIEIESIIQQKVMLNN